MSVLLKKRNIKNEFQIQKTLDKNQLDPDIQHLVAPEGHNNMECRDSGMDTLQFHSLDWVTSPEEGLIEDIWGIFDVLGNSDAAHRCVQSRVSTQVYGDWKNPIVAKTLQDWPWVTISSATRRSAKSALRICLNFCLDEGLTCNALRRSSHNNFEKAFTMSYCLLLCFHGRPQAVGLCC